MGKLSLGQGATILVHGLVGWALCGAIMGIGMAVTSIQTTLILHAIGAPIIFATISWIYFRKFKYTTPLQTAVAFLSIVVFVDFFVVALLILGNLEMFTNILGTWIPFVLIFLSTYLSGLYIESQSKHAVSS